MGPVRSCITSAFARGTLPRRCGAPRWPRESRSTASAAAAAPGLLHAAAILERAVKMHAQLIRVTGGCHHGDHRERLDAKRQCRALPYVAVGVSIDDMLQRLAEFTERIHPRLDGLAAEHLRAQRKSAIVLLLGVHPGAPLLATHHATSGAQEERRRRTISTSTTANAEVAVYIVKALR